jgi:glycosyltransferase involved in cell wall biosynthesis
VPIEAMGHGVPVIAHRSGGPRETILDGQTGMFFDELSVAGVVAAIKAFQSQSFSAKTIHRHAQQFSVETFKKKITQLVEKVNQSARAVE